MSEHITLGEVLTILTTIVTVFVANYRLGTKIGKIEMQLSLLWAWFRKEHGLGSTVINGETGTDG